jgi:hypothetical protein
MIAFREKEREQLSRYFGHGKSGGGGHIWRRDGDISTKDTRFASTLEGGGFFLSLKL